MKKFLLLTLTFLALGFAAAPVSAQTVWDGTADISWYDADQTTFDISTPEQLAGVAQLVNSGTSFNGKTLNLTADLWLNSTGDSTNNWVPIGGSATATSEAQSSGNSFRGVFNGHGHTIYNLYCEKTNYFHAGLFGCIQNPCTIDSLVMINPTVKSCGMMGAIAGMTRSGGQIYIRYCLVVNANIVGTPSGTGPSASHNNIGGIVGANYPNTSGTYIQNCGVTGNISGYYIGGIGGNAQYDYLTNCYFAGTLTPYNTNYGGMTAHDGTRTNCYSYTVVNGSQSQSSASNDGTSVTQAEMQDPQMIVNLGDAFKMDNGINNGYPVMSYMAGVDPIAAEICQGESITITAFGFDTYAWSNGSTSDVIMVSPTTTTTYTVTCTANGVSTVLSSTITVHPQAVITATVAASSDGQVHATISPETTTVPCGSSDNVTFTVTPDEHWRVASVHMNGILLYDAQTYGPFTFTVNPGGTLANVVVHMTNALTCTNVLNLHASDIYGSNATISWNAHTTGELSEYHVIVRDLAAQSESEYTTTDLSYVIMGLTENTPYQVGVYTFCLDGYGSDTTFVNFMTPCNSPVNVTVGTGTSTTSYFPTYSCYNYSYTQQIYPASAIGSEPMDFSSIFFQCSSTTSNPTRTIDIYASQVPASMNLGSGWILPSTVPFQLVFSGTVNFSANGTDHWFEIPLDTLLPFNGTDNILLSILDHTGTYSCSNSFYYHNDATTSNMSRYVYRDASTYDINGPDAAGYSSSNIANIRFVFCDESTCIRPNTVTASNVTESSADIAWVTVGSESSWEVEYKAAADTEWTSAGTVSSPEAYLTGLNGNTQYSVRVRALCGGSDMSLWTDLISFRTECAPITEIPFSENFEDASAIYSTSQDNYILCWSRYASDPAHYVYVPSSTSYAHSGTHYLDFHHTTSCFNIAIMPAIDPSISINTLMVNFWACRTGSSGMLEVGVMSDYADATTFEPIDTIDLSGMNTYAYAEQYVKFENYQGSGSYIAFRVSNAASCGFYIDDVTVDYSPECSQINSLEVTNITGSSAVIDWTDGPFGTIDSYSLEYSEAGQENWTSVGFLDTTTYVLSGLEPSTYYDVRVMVNCEGSLSSEWVMTTFHTACLVGGDVTIGNGTSTNSYLPSYSLYNYSYTQQLFLASEIGGPKGIESVTFDMSNYSVNRTYKIYMMHTTETSASSWIDATNAQLVFDAPQQLVQGLNTFQFSTPFQYNGSDNLLLIVLDMTGSWSSGNTWRTHTVPFTASRYIYQDASAYSTSEAPSSGSNSTTSERNNVIFGAGCDTTTTCVAPFVSIASVTQNSATVNWVAGYQESAWELEYRPLSDTNWVSMGTVTSMSEVLSGLTANTTYKVRMRSDCGIDYSYWTEVSFTTSCGAIDVTATQPWVEDFEGYTGGGAQPFVCWATPVTEVVDNGTSPFVYCGHSPSCHSGSNSAEMKGTNNMVVLPEFTNDIHDLRLSFWATTTSTSNYGTVEIGVITDITDPTTFEVLGPAGVPGPRGGAGTTGNGNFMGPFDFNGVQATAGRIAIRMSGYSGLSWNLDDFTVSLTPNCPSPVKTSVQASNIDGHNATITFTDNDPDHNSWTVYYKPSNDATWSSVVTSTTSVDLTGLDPETQYDVYVVTNCATPDDVEDATLTISFTTAVACPAPQNLAIANVGMTSATLTWFSNADSFTIEYGETGFTPGAGTTATVATPSYDFTGLTSGTAYTVYVTADCGTDGTSQTASFNFNTANCEIADQCAYTFLLTDSYGDGWNGGTLAVQQNGVTVTTLAATNYGYISGGATDTVLVNLCDNISTSLVWTAGSYASEASFAVIGPDGTEVYASPAMDSYSTYTFTTNCSGSGPATCQAPTNLTVNTITENSAVAIWTPGGSETSWNLQYKAATSSDWGTTIPCTQPSYSFSSLAANTQYVFRVQADCGDGDVSAWSSEQTFTTAGGSGPVVTDPTVATNAAENIAQTAATLKATITNPDNVTITAKGFQWKATNGGTYTSVTGTGTGNTFTANLTNLTPNTSYTYKAFITFNGTTVEGSEMTFTTLPEDVEPCETPTNLHASTCDAHSITIGWNANGNATSWNIRYRVENGSWSSATSTTNSYVISGLVAETVYEIQVQANCGDGNLSEWCEPIHISTTIEVGIDSWLESSVSLYPNPAREYIDIRVDGDLNVTMMEVYDVYGKLINTVNVIDNPTRINVSSLANGMYFVRVTTEAGSVTKTFVKKG